MRSAWTKKGPYRLSNSSGNRLDKIVSAAIGTGPDLDRAADVIAVHEILRRTTSHADGMAARMRDLRDRSRAAVESSRTIELFPDETDATHRGLMLGIGKGPRPGVATAPTHFSFGQLCSLAFPGNSPAGYFREGRLPAPVIANALNYDLRSTRDVDEIGLLASLGDENDLSVPSGTSDHAHSRVAG